MKKILGMLLTLSLVGCSSYEPIKEIRLVNAKYAFGVDTVYVAIDSTGKFVCNLTDRERQLVAPGDRHYCNWSPR